MHSESAVSSLATHRRHCKTVENIIQFEQLTAFLLLIQLYSPAQTPLCFSTPVIPTKPVCPMVSKTVCVISGQPGARHHCSLLMNDGRVAASKQLETKVHNQHRLDWCQPVQQHYKYKWYDSMITWWCINQYIFQVGSCFWLDYVNISMQTSRASVIHVAKTQTSDGTDNANFFLRIHTATTTSITRRYFIHWQSKTRLTGSQ